MLPFLLFSEGLLNTSATVLLFRKVEKQAQKLEAIVESYCFSLLFPGQDPLGVLDPPKGLH
jgi:hypothetical protein